MRDLSQKREVIWTEVPFYPEEVHRPVWTYKEEGVRRGAPGPED
jgi:hypothetical protein